MNHQEDEYSNGAATPRKIVLGRHPAVFVCVIQCIVYIYITGSGWLGFSDNTGGGYNLLFAVLWAAMAFGIYKYSRACAVMALVLYFIDQLAVELFPPGRSFNVAWLAGTTIWLLCFATELLPAGCGVNIKSSGLMTVHILISERERCISLCSCFSIHPVWA